MLKLGKVLGSPIRWSDVPGNHGELAVLECLGATESSVRDRRLLTLFRGATGGGKSKVRPERNAEKLAELPDFHGKLLVLTCAAKDVEDIAWAFHGDLPLQNSADDGQVLIASEWTR